MSEVKEKSVSSCKKVATVEFFREKMKLSEQDMVKVLIGILWINGGGEEKG